MATLQSQLDRAAHEYAARRKAAEDEVVRWEYYSDVAHDLRPFYFERFGLKPGRRLKTASSRAHVYGFDAKGRLIVIRQPKSDEPPFEEFFVYTPQSAQSIAYRLAPGHRPAYATMFRYRNGRLVSSNVLDSGGSDEFTERYTYRDGRLSGVECIAREGESKAKRKFDLQYDSKGRFRVLREDYGGGVFIPVHWNPDTAPSLDALGRSIRTQLLKLIPAAVSRAKIKESAYCLTIAYDVENDELPPLLGVGLDRERRKWLEAGVREARQMMWNPAEFSRFAEGPLDIDDRKLTEESGLFCQLALSRGDTWSAQRLLNGIAAELNKRPWKKILPVTDDFIVYCVDLEGVDLKANLKAGVPAARLQRLKAQKLV